MATQLSTTNQCVTAADVRACWARVHTFRSRFWPRPALPVPARPAPAPVPVPVLQIHEVDPGRVLVRNVIDATAAYFGVSVDALLSRDRHKTIASQRQVAMYVACRLTKRGLPFIGLIFDNRDHTTILHGFRRVKARLDAGDVATIEAVNAIAAQLTGGARD